MKISIVLSHDRAYLAINADTLFFTIADDLKTIVSYRGSQRGPKFSAACDGMRRNLCVYIYISNRCC